MTAVEQILRLLKRDESTTLEFKESRILSDSFKLAKVMTALANAEGGILLIGIRNDKSIEGLKAKRGHAEHIMNIASDKCEPRLMPKFEEVNIPGKGDVYKIRIFERQGPYHAVKTGGGYKFFIRVDRTTRELSPSELGFGELGVEIRIRRGWERFWSWLNERFKVEP